MRLISTPATGAKVRDELLTRGEHRTERLKVDNEYKRVHRLKHTDKWAIEKQVIDSACYGGHEHVWTYVKNNRHEANDVRSGIHSMKINPWEYALLKLALKIGGYRSTRELIISKAKEIVERKYSIDAEEAILGRYKND